MNLRPPLPKVCIALGVSHVEKLLAQSKREVDDGETFLEWRLDYLEHPERGAEGIRSFLNDHPEVSLLATCRRHHNHGRFNGSVEHELAILALAARSGACAVDVEIETAEAAPLKVGELRDYAKLIVSWHNFESTPPMEPVLKRLTRIPADAYKLVSTARKPSDAGRVLSLGRENHRIPLIVLAMGEVGFLTRVLSPACHGIFTYAAPLGTDGTASGQVAARTLRRQYRVERLTRETKIFCVVADPVRHSLSPVVHNRAFQMKRIDSVYVPMQVPTGQLRDFFKLADELPIAGFSVTLPHKQKVMRYLDQIEPLARRIGAVNTVWRKAGKWRGANTDAAAVVRPVAALLPIKNSRILIAGSGGAARAAACALADAGAAIYITGRNVDRARTLARFAGGEAIPREQSEGMQFDAVVHATPLGTYPNVDGCFFEGKIPGDIVFDMVYNPMETTLLKRAKKQGKQTIPGIKMFVEQAVAQFEIWTGESAPRAAMEKAALDALADQRTT